ncbi:MAG: class I SAM-dependent rRNA methyltransferase [Terriglobales bacterium]
MPPRISRRAGNARSSPALQGSITVNWRAAARLHLGHVWVYRSDILSAGDAAPASLVSVNDEAGRPLGSALYSSSSQIALRFLGPDKLDAKELVSELRKRLRAAIEYRNKIVTNSDAYRVAFSEADGLPGLVIDKYDDVLSLQVLSQVMDRADIRDALLAELIEQLEPAGVVENVDARIRRLETLPPREEGLLHGSKQDTIFHLNGVGFHFHGLSGQKTGAFLDQRENYAAAARYAHGSALDVFTYQGGFALHLARKCAEVTAVDSSRPALEVAEKNEQLNREHHAHDIEWTEANAFDLLKDYATARRHYDTIVLDPPAFAKSKKTMDAALRGYKELNLRALKMLNPGGVLVTCSCSFHVSEGDFLDMLRAAAADARRTVKVLERRGQSQDHPVLLGVPETAYLKCVILQA